MGAVISKAANGIGAVVGSAFVAPFKTIFGQSCVGVCSGTWDIICFIEHLCVYDLVKLLMVFGLSYITLLFFYLLFKIGIIQCIGRSFCKMTWAACETYWHAMEDICCFMWHKLKNTKRVNRLRHRHRHRRQFLDIEEGSSTKDVESYRGNSMGIRRRRSVRERRKDHIQSSLYRVRPGSKQISRSRSSIHHHMRLKSGKFSVHLKDSHGRKSRKLRPRNVAKGRELRLVKRRVR